MKKENMCEPAQSETPLNKREYVWLMAYLNKDPLSAYPRSAQAEMCLKSFDRMFKSKGEDK